MLAVPTLADQLKLTVELLVAVAVNDAGAVVIVVAVA